MAWARGEYSAGASLKVRVRGGGLDDFGGGGVGGEDYRDT